MTRIGNTTIESEKSNPFQVGNRAEALRCGRRLEVAYSAGWTVATLICKDLLDTELVRLVEDFEIALVLVPSLSPKSEGQGIRAENLAFGAQSIVLYANHAEPDSDAMSMIVGAPRSGATTRTKPRASVSPPCLLGCALEAKGSPTIEEYDLENC